MRVWDEYDIDGIRVKELLAKMGISLKESKEPYKDLMSVI